MRDYFGSILSSQVTGVTRSDASLECTRTRTSIPISTVTPASINKSDRGDNMQGIQSPSDTSVKTDGVTLGTPEIAMFPPSPVVTPDYDELLYLYEERAGIYQFEANYSREIAEQRAYQDTFMKFLVLRYPTIQAEFEASIFQPKLH